MRRPTERPSDRDLARWRLATQHLTGTAASDPTALVRELLAVQAENHAQATWAVAARCGPVTRREFDAAFDRGDILRLHVLRTTWHFVAPADVVWLARLTGPRLRPLYRQSQRAYAVDDRTLVAAMDAVVDAIAELGPRTRPQLRDHLERAALPAAGPALTLITASAEAEALICSGPIVDGEHTHALVAQRAPGARALDRDEALAEIASRYLAGHGPATAKDLGYWATLTVGDARRGIEAASAQLASFEHDGRTFWHRADAEPPGRKTVSAHLLQILDEIYRGYQDSRWVLDTERLLPRGREASIGMALVDGQIAAAMARTVDPGGVDFRLTPFRALSAAEQRRLAARRRRLRRLPRATGHAVHRRLTSAGAGRRTMERACRGCVSR